MLSGVFGLVMARDRWRAVRAGSIDRFWTPSLALPFVAAALVAWSGSWWPVACYAAFLAACTAFAIWCGPETYEESITVDNTSDGKMHAAAVLQQA